MYLPYYTILYYTILYYTIVYYTILSRYTVGVYRTAEYVRSGRCSVDTTTVQMMFMCVLFYARKSVHWSAKSGRAEAS